MLNEEVVKIVAETVSFWSPVTTACVIAASLFLLAGVCMALASREGVFIAMGALVGVATMIAAGLFSSAGQWTAIEDSLQEQLTQTVGIENLEYSDKSFTGSIDGRYVKGTVVPLGHKEYQVVELVTK